MNQQWNDLELHSCLLNPHLNEQCENLEVYNKNNDYNGNNYMTI